MPSISIVILTWNGLTLTRRCIESLEGCKLPDATEIIVVDNGSVDGTVSYLRNRSGITLIENQENLGYAKAVNIGIRAANPAADVVLLNNDVELIQPDWLFRLRSAAYSDDQIGIAGVKILLDNGTIQHCGAYMPVDTYWGQQVGSGEADIEQYAGICQCESVVFACAYLKRATLESVGLLCDDYFAYFEDSDYCLRASTMGLRTVIDGRIKVVHSENSSTQVNKVSHKDIFLESQAKFRKTWSKYLEAERYSDRVDWHSIINFPSGYGSTSRSLVAAMDKIGLRVAYRYVYGPGTIFPVAEPEHSTSYVVNCVRGRKFGEARVQVVYGQGDVFERNTGDVRIGFTMLEVDGIPSEWVRQANTMDEVWVPSHFNARTFADSGVSVPIRVMPLGIDPAYLSPAVRSKKPSGSFVFLSVFEWGERKAPEILLRAFTDEFRKKEPVALVCKVNNFDGAIDVRTEVEKLRLRSDGGRVVVALNQILQGYEIGVLYRSADCFVLPTRGEGWGMPIMEAMACGLPVIATNWSAHTEFMNESNAYPLEVERLIPAVAKCPYYAGFKWAEPSYEELRRLMRHVYEHQDEARAIGAKAADEVRRTWTWEASARAILARVQGL